MNEIPRCRPAPCTTRRDPKKCTTQVTEVPSGPTFDSGQSSHFMVSQAYKEAAGGGSTAAVPVSKPSCSWQQFNLLLRFPFEESQASPLVFPVHDVSPNELTGTYKPQEVADSAEYCW